MDAHALKISKNWAEQSRARIAALRRPLGTSWETAADGCASRAVVSSFETILFSESRSNEEARVVEAEVFADSEDMAAESV